MRILVVDKSVSGRKLKDVSFSLFKHLEFWGSNYNQIDLFARVDDSVSGKLKNKFNLVKLPPRFIFLDLIYVYFYLLFKSKKYDLAIEIWEKKPNCKLIFNTRRSLVLILSSDFRCILPGKIFRFIYRKTKFMVNSLSVKDKLIKLGSKNGDIYYIPDGIDTKKETKQEMLLRKKNKILILCGKDIDGAVSIIGLIERRTLDWKFVVLSEKKNIMKLKHLYENSGLTSSMKPISITDPVFDMNVVNSKFLIITKGFKNLSNYISKAFLRGTPLIAEGFNHVAFGKSISDLVLVCGNKMDIAAKILSLTKNEAEYKKLQDKISKTSLSHTWEEIGYLSRKYIESL